MSRDCWPAYGAREGCAQADAMSKSPRAVAALAAPIRGRTSVISTLPRFRSVEYRLLAETRLRVVEAALLRLAGEGVALRLRDRVVGVALVFRGVLARRR